VYVEDVNDEVPVFTQRQYNRLGLRETAGIGTSVAVVRATDRDTGRGWLGCSPVGWALCWWSCLVGMLDAMVLLYPREWRLGQLPNPVRC